MTSNASLLIPLSSFRSVAWPAMPDTNGTAMLALQYQLEQSQWWPPDLLRAKQMDQLQALLPHACNTINFYRERLGAAGYVPGQPLTEAIWQAIPILTRSEIQRAGDALLSRRIPAAHGKPSEVQTSGSTGQPMKTYGTGITQFFWQVFTLRDHLWQRRELGGKLAIIRYWPDGSAAPPAGLHLPGWGPSTDAAFHTGPSSVLSIDSSITQQVEWLRKENPDYLLTHPTVARALAEHFIEHGLSLPGLREIRTLSEAMPPDLRALCQQAWGVPVVDMYTTREAGYVALQCPEHFHYHIQSENVLVEILDANGMPCEPGQTGRVVLTSLHNFAYPLIRYEIGDYAEMGEPCPCGRGLPVIKRVMGRVRNMMQLPGGEQRWPLLNYQAYREIVPLRQLQMVQRSSDGIEVHLVTERAITADEESRLAEAIRTSLGYDFTLNFHYCQEIPRSKSGKFEDFMCEIPVTNIEKS
jgi:phenylacetate-CoA ligase